MAKRKSTGKRQRFAIFHRDSFTCQYCGRTPPDVVLVVDHIIPVASGGETIAENLITSCEPCNQGKAAKSLGDSPRPVADVLRDQVNRREQLEEYNRWLIAARKREQQTAKEIGTHWCDSMRPPSEAGKWTVSNRRLSSIAVFMKRLPITEIYDAIDIAMSRKRPSPHYDELAWKYFCGICWSKIRQREGDQNGAS